MQFVQVIILGIVQGLTEFIPVSSSGHLIIFDRLLNFNGGLTFDLALHIGTLAALLLIFWPDFWKLAQGVIKRQPTEIKLAGLLAIATVPAIIFGVLLQSKAETIFRSPQLVAINLIIVGLIMLLVDRAATLKQSVDQLTTAKAAGIGLAQAAALVPGVSRSGATITAGLAIGLDRVSATRFSFLLSAPVIAGAIAKVVLGGEGIAQLSAQPWLFLVGMAASFVSGYAAIKFLLAYLSRHGLAVFAYYRMALGVLVLTAGAARWI